MAKASNLFPCLVKEKKKQTEKTNSRTLPSSNLESGDGLHRM